MSKETKQKLLECAEYMFAEKGIEETSVRALTASAGVNLASVNYHFGSKTGLIEQLLALHLKQITLLRKQSLDDAILCSVRQKRSLQLEDVLHALIDPIFDYADQSRRHRAFLGIYVQCVGGRDRRLRSFIERRNRSLFKAGYEALTMARPHVGPQVLLQYMRFVIDSMYAAISIQMREGTEAGWFGECGDTSKVRQQLFLYLASGLDGA